MSIKNKTLEIKKNIITNNKQINFTYFRKQ